MYQAKAGGRGGIRAWSDDGASPLQRLSVRARLRRGIDGDELLLHYQPIVDPASGALAGLEALVRWEDPERGLVPPADFIPVAEHNGLIDDLGLWVLQAVCAQKVAWRAEGLDPVVSINTSLHELQRDDFAHGLLDRLDRHGVRARRPRGGAHRDNGDGRPQPRRAADPRPGEAGVRIAIDDLGAGASSLARLQELPVQLLKLDRSFLRDVPQSAQARALVRALVDLSAALETVLVVEGVETEEQRRFLAAAGCPLASGLPAGAAGPRRAALTGMLRAAAAVRQ
jgi:EAL domain-containing protein (putative c-di-GMP-specific phosphodiesterase class I)